MGPYFDDCCDGDMPEDKPKMSNGHDYSVGHRTSDGREATRSNLDRSHESNKHWNPSDVQETGLVDREPL
jgi:hypothetical protein